MRINFWASIDVITKNWRYFRDFLMEKFKLGIKDKVDSQQLV